MVDLMKRRNANELSKRSGRYNKELWKITG